MDSLPCPRCGYLCDMHHGRWKTTAVCPQCRKRFTFKTQRLRPQWSRLFMRLWPVLAMVAVALALSVPAAMAVIQEPDVAKALHGDSNKDFARYCLYGAAAVAAMGGLWFVRRNARMEPGTPQ